MMNREELAKLYEKANGWSPAAFPITMEELERFAALVAAYVRETEFKPDWNNYQQGRADGAADEREACAKVCEEQEDDGGEWDIQQQCANAIRARNNT